MENEISVFAIFRYLSRGGAFMPSHLLLESPAEEFLQIILNALKDLVDYELAVILKFRDATTLDVQKADGPLLNEKIARFSIDLENRKDLAELINRKQPYVFPEDQDHVDTYEEILDLPEGHSCMIAPLHLEDSPVGLLTLDHRVCRKYTPDVVRFIGSISRLISIILSQNDTSRYLLEQSRKLTEERNLLLQMDDERFRRVIGRSAPWQAVLDSVKIVAGSDLSVLIQGETGTGKEEIARLVHRLSSRKDGPFIALNCSALSPSLAESELFGHEKGAFTGAYSRKKGRFELAHGGTLFLDEIGDLPAELQPKILRALQEGVYERVGGEESVFSNVRVIAASHVDLAGAVENRSFREDLFYRLSEYPVYLPSLRERGDDVILLAEYFVNNLRKEGDYPFLQIDRGALDALASYKWPGNVRELYNYIRRGAVLSGGTKIRREHLFSGNHLPETSSPPPASMMTLDDAIASHIRAALQECGGKIYGPGGAAERLDVKPSTLQSKMKKLGIHAKEP